MDVESVPDAKSACQSETVSVHLQCIARQSDCKFASELHNDTDNSLKSLLHRLLAGSVTMCSLIL